VVRETLKHSKWNKWIFPINQSKRSCTNKLLIGIIVSKFSGMNMNVSIGQRWAHKVTQHILNNAVDSLSLTITLRMIGNRKGRPSTQKFEQFLSELTLITEIVVIVVIVYKHGTPVGQHFSRHTMQLENAIYTKMAKFSAVTVVLVGIKCAYLDSLSTTTRIAS
jgi:hypothetical protein